MGHKDVETTMIYTHAKGASDIVSPLDSGQVRVIKTRVLVES